MEIFRPIALSNLKYKIISKILVDRISSLLPSLISIEQMGFINGINIRDCTYLASEVINVLDNKCAHGNLAFKIDIAKAFDTIRWDFLICVLKQFGFCKQFCDWISVLLSSSIVSINYNGVQHGYFKFSQGVRQEDPLSLIMFCLDEDVLSMSIGKLVLNGEFDLIKSSKNTFIPSHILYANDILILYTGKSSNIRAFKKVFHEYVIASGQNINLSKSFIFSGAVGSRKLKDC